MVTVARTQQKALGFATSLCSLAIIARLTLRPLGGPLPFGFHTCLFCGSFGFADFLLNIALFIPLGLGLRLLGLRRWHIFVLGLALATTIETLQDFVISGREAGINDMVSNPIGALCGAFLADALPLLFTPTPVESRRLALGAAGAWLALGLALPLVTRPSLPRAVYWEQVAADLPRYGKYRGQIVSAEYNGRPFATGRLSDSASAAMRSDFLRGVARVNVITVAAPSIGRVAPIVGVFDKQQEEIFMVACAGSDLVFGVRTRLDDLRLHSPAHCLHGVIPCDRPSVNDTVRIAATVDRRGVVLSTERGGRVASSRPDAGAWQGWRLLINDSYGKQAQFNGLVTIVWLGLAFGPLGYWLARTGWAAWIRAGVPAATFAGSFAIIPLFAGSPAASSHVWLAAVIELGLAYGVSFYIHGRQHDR